jgi:hypothetical protein
MTKRTAFLHVGPTVPGPGALHTALYGDPSLAAAGVKLPAVGQHLLDDADLEIRRRHSDVGLRRKDVEGSWAKVCRAASKAKADVLVSQPGLGEATPEQVALAVDGFLGMRVHVVVTPGDGPAGDGPDDLVARWAPYVRRSSRVHVLPVTGSVTTDELGARLARLVLLARDAEMERRLITLAKQRRKVRDRLGRVDAA